MFRGVENQIVQIDGRARDGNGDHAAQRNCEREGDGQVADGLTLRSVVAPRDPPEDLIIFASSRSVSSKSLCSMSLFLTLGAGTAYFHRI